ncbi:hypothetical protein AOLI_G00017000 [Acnodon oligacanthus]
MLTLPVSQFQDRPWPVLSDTQRVEAPDCLVCVLWPLEPTVLLQSQDMLLGAIPLIGPVGFDFMGDGTWHLADFFSPSQHAIALSLLNHSGERCEIPG